MLRGNHIYSRIEMEGGVGEKGDSGRMLSSHISFLSHLCEKTGDPDGIREGGFILPTVQTW